jgi:hypothetical protein
VQDSCRTSDKDLFVYKGPGLQLLVDNNQRPKKIAARTRLAFLGRLIAKLPDNKDWVAIALDTPLQRDSSGYCYWYTSKLAVSLATYTGEIGWVDARELHGCPVDDSQNPWLDQYKGWLQ